MAACCSDWQILDLKDSALKPVAKNGTKEGEESKTVQSNNISVLSWQDNKPVTIAATKSNPVIEEQVSRSSKQYDGSSIPLSVVLYNENMGGVG